MRDAPSGALILPIGQRRPSCISGFCFFPALAVALFPLTSLRSDDTEALIKGAISAAPKAIGEAATIVTFDATMETVVLRKGTNNITCIPDDPTTPTDDPVCTDENGLAWSIALMHHDPAPPPGIGFGYMLMGETAASNVDPFAAPPTDGKWHQAGPHIMIMNARDGSPGYPRPGLSPDVAQPWVMWSGTPYEHLMIPVPAE
jgi:hypothetical protein